MTRVAWPSLAAVLILLGLVFASPWSVQLGVLVLGVGLVSWLWARLALRSVTYQRALSADRVFAGDSVTLTVTLRNDKVLPLAWLRVTDGVPEALDYGEHVLGASANPGRLEPGPRGRHGPL